MMNLTMCGFCCEMCKAYAPNIENNDRREEMACLWKTYYNLDYNPKDIYCDGCRCEKPDAKRLEVSCPVRTCVMQKNISHCGECTDYPCDTFLARKGLSIKEMEALNPEFDVSHYNDFFNAYDNKTHLDELRIKSDNLEK